jgi:aryl-alcohol dehydrogenase-like predicted oxidoreductase
MQYRLLGKSGLRVSELCLGTMTFGEDWGYGADREGSLKIFNAFLEAGGNFIDTANRYTEGSSEEFLGDFIRDSGRRDEIVLATKYSLVTRFNRINDGGNHRKNLVQSLEGSLKRLKTGYVDVLYLHAWDFTTPEEEVLRALDDMVRAGKVMYIGISDTPAWIISRSCAIAELRGWSQFIALQAEYSLITRDAERELLPMAEALDIGVTAWAPLAGGALTGKYLAGGGEAKRMKPDNRRLNERGTAITAALLNVAKELGRDPAQVALNWLRQKPGVIIPVIGARRVEQLQQNLGCLDFTLPEEAVQRLDRESAIELGFPHEFLRSEGVQQVLFGGLKGKIHNHRIR